MAFPKDDITPLQDMVRTYAFQHDCDLDQSTFHVLMSVIHKIAIHEIKLEGLYDRLFTKKKAKL